MNCRKIRRLLSPYLDEEMAPGVRLAVASHLSRCRGCQELFSEMRRIRLLLLATPRHPVPGDFARGWRSRLMAEKAPAASRPRPFPLLIPAMGTLILGLLVLTIVRLWPVPSPLKLGPLHRTAEPGGVASSSPQRVEPSVAPVLPSPPTGGALEKKPIRKKAVSSPREAVESSPFTPIGEKASPVLEDDRLSVAVTGDATKEEKPGEGLWRLWLVAPGVQPEEVRRILTEEGFLVEGRESLILHLPMLLKEGTSREAVSDLAMRLEAAGGRVRLEFVPR
ncbi:MAG: hypothetical protein GX493_07430 [Firmicutes bacterium]|nr:hypothetical protein [Bacillota bacterium]